MSDCPFVIGQWVQTNSLGVGKVMAFILENGHWKIHVGFFPKTGNFDHCWFASESIRLATYLEILLYV